MSSPVQHDASVKITEIVAFIETHDVAGYKMRDKYASNKQHFQNDNKQYFGLCHSKQSQLIKVIKSFSNIFLSAHNSLSVSTMNLLLKKWTIV